MSSISPLPGEVIQVTSKAALAEAVLGSSWWQYSKPQTFRPTIIFTNGYPDADATVQDVRDRVERLSKSHDALSLSDPRSCRAAVGRALIHAEAELHDLGVAL